MSEWKHFGVGMLVLVGVLVWAVFGFEGVGVSPDEGVPLGSPIHSVSCGGSRLISPSEVGGLVIDFDYIEEQGGQVNGRHSCYTDEEYSDLGGCPDVSSTWTGPGGVGASIARQTCQQVIRDYADARGYTCSSSCCPSRRIDVTTELDGTETFWTSFHSDESGDGGDCPAGRDNRCTQNYVASYVCYGTVSCEGSGGQGCAVAGEAIAF